ncbi:DNA repair protein RecO [Candidatus Microgenomates bacterium]|jgi:DNA repair protein RecO (recombination protein O)|nr:DNA repair protein RecO [Candidatus Microgenomates bacterium]
MGKDTVTVIKSINYSEADKILTVFGRELGKFSLIAKGIRKINSKNRGNMQTLSTSKVSFFEGKGIPILTESQLEINLDIEKLNVENVRRVLFLLNKFLQEYDPYPKLFDVLQRTLQKELDLESTNKLRIRFLKEMGFLEDFSSCIYCGSSEDLKYLDTQNFALVCKNCYSKGKGKPLGKTPYSSDMLTRSLDRYIKKVVEEI